MTLDIATIATLDHSARQHFTYKKDPVSFDNWRSHADDVLAGQAWQGDCDDLTSTVLDLCGRKGMSLPERYRLIVDSDHDGKPDHMVGCVLDSKNQLWIVGDTFVDHPYPILNMKHKPYEYNRLSEAGEEPVWRAGVPWHVT